jgi:hypothetical protein
MSISETLQPMNSEYPDDWYDDEEFVKFDTLGKSYLADALMALAQDFDSVHYDIKTADNDTLVHFIEAIRKGVTYSVWLNVDDGYNTIAAMASHYGVPSKAIYETLLIRLGWVFERPETVGEGTPHHWAA